MTRIRTNDMQFVEDREKVASEYKKLKYGETIQMKSFDDYEKVREQLQARKKSVSRRKYIKNTLGMRHTFLSNGETAKEYFNKKLLEDNLYCLDEPENSMSPKLQLELAEDLEERARYCGCQFIIATHSPFILAMSDAKIYNLDDTPVSICKWWELENTKTYFDFFYKHKGYFLK